MIQLFLTNVAALAIEACRGQVSRARWEKASRYRNDTDRRLSLGVELLLNYGLKRLGIACPHPVDCTWDARGKPCLSEIPLEISLSHAGDLAVCAFADSPVGVDVERETAFDATLVQTFFHPNEISDIEASPSPRARFFALWTLKESYLKAHGCGLARPLDSFWIDQDEKRVHSGGRIETCRLQSWQKGDYHLAACVRSDTPIELACLLETDIRDCLAIR